ncbi:uncharacterized protein LOC124880390 isoform X2 [Girardinichthys multiradiatus]|uniref:uncharacterized protein LOC124880390 isoform X2 n=1 Tax=Girardinichthys multiradiatus TaxID=208333 RepID=UPI001FAD257A|nr:uncharacterized protein LOC124880390 isoform X2 [Girardinichthys multiradiatus]XP_047241421.1 uncharacterized protein LOC124880390 isoform X2 [Girardinichthys multiradiatus]
MWKSCRNKLEIVITETSTPYLTKWDGQNMPRVYTLSSIDCWRYAWSCYPARTKQLVSEGESSNMKVLPMIKDISPLLEDSQTVLEDYIDAVEYRRGTLNPDQHQADPDDKSSTYTLTNVVPLITDFLETCWNPYLDTIRRRLNNFCHGKSYIVTGVTVSGATVKRDNKDRLSIPKHVWMGYCCPKFDRNSPYEVRFMFPSYGGYALNEQTGNNVVEVPLKKLETFLRSHTEADIDMTIFYKGCVSENGIKKRRDLPSVDLQPV